MPVIEEHCVGHGVVVVDGTIEHMPVCVHVPPPHAAVHVDQPDQEHVSAQCARIFFDKKSTPFLFRYLWGISKSLEARREYLNEGRERHLNRG